MKKLWISLAVVFVLVVVVLLLQRPDRKSAVRTAGTRTFSSFDPAVSGEKLTPALAIRFEQADLAQVLKVYAEISGRSIIRAATLPDVNVTFSNQTPMTAVEILQALDTVLAAQGITTVFLGTQYVKIVPAREAHLEPGPVLELKPEQLPDSSSFLIYIVRLKHVSASQAAMAVQPFAKLPNSVVTIGPGAGGLASARAAMPNLPPNLFGGNEGAILVLRDYSSNVRRMLQVIEKMERR